MNRRMKLHVACAALALLAPHARAAATCAAEPAGYRITLPGAWSVSDRDGIVSYRRDRPLEAVTTAAYRIENPRLDAAQRRELVLRAADLGRRNERALGGAGLTLTEPAAQRRGNTLRLRYSGEDPALDRRFTQLLVADGCVLRTFYYEAVGRSATAFARRAAEVMRRFEGALEPARPLAGTGLSARLNLSPALPALPVGPRTPYTGR